MFYFVTIFFSFLVLHNTLGNDELCIVQESCERCLAADYNCGWCTEKNFDGQFRCMPQNKLLSNGCPAEKIVTNHAEIVLLKNEDPQDYNLENQNVIQIQPQKMKMKLVKSHTQSFKMKYRPARNYPLDLYYLMDLTWSMKDDKETLVKLGDQLAHTLGRLTETYRLGFGSFADKPAMPMIMPGKEDNPCGLEQSTCKPTYGFHHHLALTNNVQEFFIKVNASEVTGNLDNLEGGLDALMQVLVCTEKIGWKEDTHTRKIIIFATDGLLHFAGDGVLAGIVKKNDKQCHLNEKGEYTGTLEFDYPSLEEIYRELMKRKINVIFAVTTNVAKVYRQVHKLMPEITGVEILSLDSSNILELVKTGYTSVVEKVNFIDNSPPYISITYETDCGGRYPFPLTRHFCKELEIGKDIEFNIRVTLKDYPTDGKFNHKIRIEDPGMSEHLEIDVEIQKPCPCLDDENEVEEKSQLCNSNGRFHCGMCFCYEGWIGKSCHCNAQNYTTMKELNKNCRAPKEGTELSPICSDRGECECGQCYCNRGFNGKFCECPDCHDCDDAARMECHCGRCECKKGWTGSDCSCSVSTDRCISPTNELCSNHGTCKCNKCRCARNFFGQFCEANVMGLNNLCAYFDPCVKCHIEKTQGINDCENISEVCGGNDGEEFTVEFSPDEFDSEITCYIYLENKDGEKCRHQYAYWRYKHESTHLAIRLNECIPVNFAAVGSLIALATVLAGLVIICLVKFIVRFHDAAEYAKFERDRAGTSMQMNAIYREAKTRYTVPYQSEEEIVRSQ